MPWSGKIAFREDVLAPSNVFKIEYVGKEPFKICTVAMKLIRETLKITSKDMREDDVRWDLTGDSREFYCIWRGKRGEDKWTSTWVKMTVHGFINKERTGSVKIKLEGWLQTKFSYSTPIHHWLWRMFNYLFYWRQRRSYIDYDKDELYTMREQILRMYDILRE